MTFNFEFFLTIAVLISGLSWLIEKGLQRKTAKPAETRFHKVIAQISSFFPVLLFVLLIRSFIFEPFTVVSGSLRPSLLIGDYTIVNKFTYGLRLPVLHTELLKLNTPKVGDIALFRWPIDPSKNFIKRVIGTPGDHIRYIDKVLYINGKEASQQLQTDASGLGDNILPWPVLLKQETLNGTTHSIYQRPDVPAPDFDIVVPEGQYFMMGDNRDDSNDSRYWGFVPEANLIGKGYLILFSWDSEGHKLRWQRLAKKIK